MNYEIIGPEQRIIGRTEAMDLAMPGQLRIPLDVSIAKHIAQFDTNDHYSARENEAYTRLSDIQGLVDKVPSKLLIRKMASLCDKKNLENDHTLRRVVAHMQSHYMKSGDIQQADLDELCRTLAKEQKVAISELAKISIPNSPNSGRSLSR